MSDPGDMVGVLVFVLTGSVISALNEAWRRAVSAMSRSEEGLRVTLASIGDGVITTDQGHCEAHCG